MPRRCAANAGKARDRGSVAALPAPAPSRTSPAQALRPLWLRCERVIQEEITTGRTVSKDETLTLEIIMSTINHTETSPTAAVCENLQLFGGAPDLGETDTRVIWTRTKPWPVSNRPFTSSRRP